MASAWNGECGCCNGFETHCCQYIFESILLRSHCTELQLIPCNLLEILVITDVQDYDDENAPLKSAVYLQLKMMDLHNTLNPFTKCISEEVRIGIV